MKLKSIIFFFAVVFIFGLNSCKDEILEYVPSMKATIGGTAWSSTATVVGAKIGSTITIVGYVKDGKKVTVSIIDENAPELKTYKLIVGQDADAGCVFLEDEANESDKYLATTGEVTITNINGSRLDGTFKFTVYKNTTEKIEITGGEFKNVPYL